ncbi:GCN5-like N-acetyltransferase [Hypoxylon sp. FL1284]|nr:GCN5-like N-acetyltransferase [Hypoxylon sp. FL1284]
MMEESEHPYHATKTTTPGSLLAQQPVTVRPIAAAETYALRHAVLWPSKPASYVELPDDVDGQHFGAFVAVGVANRDAGSQGEGEEVLVSIISLFPGAQGEAARFRKFATAPAWQGRGVGSALLAHAIDAAARAGASSVWCDARQSARGFYQRFGLLADGPVFCKGDVPYLRMSKPLP